MIVSYIDYLGTLDLPLTIFRQDTIISNLHILVKYDF